MRSQVEDLLSEIANAGKTLPQVMADYEIADQEQYYRTIADSIGADFVDLGDHEVPMEIQRLIPGGTARLHGALPIGESGNSIVTALLDPLDSQVVDDLRFALGRDIQVTVAPAHQVEDRLRKYYGADMANMDDILKELGTVGEIGYGGDINQGDLANEANAAPIIRFVDLILYQAIQDRASDIHFEPFEHEFKIRYRVDGALYEMAPPPRHLALPVISRVKVMANLNIAERRLPQDGRIQRSIADRAVDLRVSTLPTQYGESVVLARARPLLGQPRPGGVEHACLHLRTTWSKPSRSPTASSSSPGPPARARRRRSTPACARSTPSRASCSPPRTRWSTTSRG